MRCLDTEGTAPSSYIERSPLSLGKLSIQDDIVTYFTKDGAAHACLAVALAKAEVRRSRVPRSTFMSHTERKLVSGNSHQS